MNLPFVPHTLMIIEIDKIEIEACNMYHKLILCVNKNHKVNQFSCHRSKKTVPIIYHFHVCGINFIWVSTWLFGFPFMSFNSFEKILRVKIMKIVINLFSKCQVGEVFVSKWCGKGVFRACQFLISCFT